MEIDYIGAKQRKVHALELFREKYENDECPIMTQRLTAYTVTNWENYVELDKLKKSDRNFIRWVLNYQQDPNYKFYRFIKDYEKSN